MKSLVIYCSKCNTEKIAKVFADKMNADLKNLKTSGDIKIEEYDLIGFGAGVYMESLSPHLIKFVEQLDVKGKNVFVFSTSGAGATFYNKKLINLLEAKGAICKGSFACRGSFMLQDLGNNKFFGLLSKFARSHPNDKDLVRAEKFISALIG